MGSTENAVVAGGAVAVDKGVDYAQYFCTYSFLYHQKEMLSDRVRMDAYFNAIFKNKHHFDGKVTLFLLLFDYLLCLDFRVRSCVSFMVLPFRVD